MSQTQMPREEDPAPRAVHVHDTGDATATGPGAIANTGFLTIHQHGAPVPQARSAYLHLVRQLAPGKLSGRESELTELEAFCTAASGSSAPSYVWWQAPAWAGKTTLMSWFVLHPPAGVRILSFFVSAVRGQSDRITAAHAIAEQLAELVREPAVAQYTDAALEAHLLRLLAAAADTCLSHGERLVLVIDGLDEDTGVPGRPTRPSIAALLPARPPSGLRIVVTGRPHPPVPPDVPDDHPLRDPEIIRHLTPSGAAKALKNAATHDLDRLLDGAQPGHHLLGLIIAARGELSCDDLAHLTGNLPGDVRRFLDGPAGRVFKRATWAWGTRKGVETYSLAHDELRRQASEYFGTDSLHRYEKRIHDWAADYASRGWPGDTPEYLLRHYPRLLETPDQLTALVACATDWARHTRLFSVTGDDSTAHREIVMAQQLALASPAPDLLVIARLALHRRVLIDRQYYMPAGLPELWAELGYPERGEYLAVSVRDADERVKELRRVIRAVSRSGAVDEARRMALNMEDPSHRNEEVVLVALAAAIHSRWQEAEDIAADVDSQEWQAFFHANCAIIAAGRGEADRAAHCMARASAALEVPDFPLRARIVSDIAIAAVHSGDMNRAIHLVDSLDDDNRNEGLRELVEVVLNVNPPGIHAVARAFPDPAIRLAAAIVTFREDHPPPPTERSTAVARYLCDLALSIEPAWPMVVSSLVDVLVEAGMAGRARAFTLALPEGDMRLHAVRVLSFALAESGDTRGAESVVASVPESEQFPLLLNLAQAGLSLQNKTWSTELAHRAHQLLCTLERTTPVEFSIFRYAGHVTLISSAQEREAIGLCAIAEILRAADEPAWAEALLRQADRLAHESSPKNVNLTMMAAIALRGDNVDRAITLAEAALAEARMSPLFLFDVHSELAIALARNGESSRALRLASRIASESLRELTERRVAAAEAKCDLLAGSASLPADLCDLIQGLEQMTGWRKRNQHHEGLRGAISRIAVPIRPELISAVTEHAISAANTRRLRALADNAADLCRGLEEDGRRQVLLNCAEAAQAARESKLVLDLAAEASGISDGALLVTAAKSIVRVISARSRVDIDLDHHLKSPLDSARVALALSSSTGSRPREWVRDAQSFADPGILDGLLGLQGFRLWLAECLVALARTFSAVSRDDLRHGRTTCSLEAARLSRALVRLADAAAALADDPYVEARVLTATAPLTDRDEASRRLLKAFHLAEYDIPIDTLASLYPGHVVALADDLLDLYPTTNSGTWPITAELPDCKPFTPSGPASYSQAGH